MTATRPAPPTLDLPDLTLPRDEPRTVKRVLGLYFQKVLADLGRIPLGAVTPGNRPLYQETVRQLQVAGTRDPRRPLQIVRWPTISTLVQVIHAQLTPGGDLVAANAWLREACALVLLELAAGGDLDGDGLTLGRDETGRLPKLLSPLANMCVIPGRVVDRVLFRPGRLDLAVGEQRWPVPLRDPTWQPPPGLPATVERPYHQIVPGLYLATVDNNPLSEFEAHPDKHGNQLDLGDKPAQAWVDELRACLELVDAHLPALGEEIRLVMRVIVPVGWDAEKHLSASYQEAVGQMYLTLHPQRMTMAEALVHEFQHNKINAVFRLDPLLHNAWSPLYASPVRPDPRPLHGVVLAVHAFQPVARLYEEMAAAGHPMAQNPHWWQRFAQIVRLNREGAATVLDNARATPAGRGLFAEMRALDQHFAELAQRRWPSGESAGGEARAG